MTSPDYGLIADIGGTHVRFTIADPKTGAPDIASLKIYTTKDHSDIAAAARSYLAARKIGAPPRAIVFAVAGPVAHGEITLTNAGWHIRESDLRADLKTQNAHLVNDFEALAMAVPALAKNGGLKPMGGPSFDATKDGTIAIVGPGTGLGVGGAVRKNGESSALVTEGGHAAFAPSDDTEIKVLEFLAKKFRRVSNERLLSGPGIFNLYSALSEIEGKQAADMTPEAITKTAREKPDSFEAKVFARFCAILGAVAGDVALTMGARNGVLIGGGILQDTVEVLVKSDFRKRFEEKARFTDYMKGIPTLLIVDPHAGLIGAGAILARDTA